MITLKVFLKQPRELNPKPFFFFTERKDGFLTDNAFHYFRKLLQTEDGLIETPSECISLYIKDGLNYKPIQDLNKPLLEKENYYCLVTPQGWWDVAKNTAKDTAIAAGIGFAIGGPVGALIAGGATALVSGILNIATEQQDQKAEAEQTLVEQANREFSQLDRQSPIKGTQFIRQQSPTLNPILHDNRVNPGSVVPENFGLIKVKARALSPMFLYGEKEGSGIREIESLQDLDSIEYYFIQFLSCGEGKTNLGRSDIKFNNISRFQFNSYGDVLSETYDVGDTIDLNRLDVPSGIKKEENLFDGLASLISLSSETGFLLIRKLEFAEPPFPPSYGQVPRRPQPSYENIRLSDGSRGTQQVPSQSYYTAIEKYNEDVQNYNNRVKARETEYKNKNEAFTNYQRKAVREQNAFKQAAVNTIVRINRKIPDYTQEPAITAETTTSNPAVIAAYMLQSIIERSNAPVTLADIADLSAFREWKNFCITKALEFNGSFDFEATAFQALKAVFFVGMAEIDTSFGKIRPIIKKQRSALNQIFHSRNIKNLQYSKIGRRLPEKITGTFLNGDKDFKPDEVSIYTAGGVAGAHPPGTFFDITSGLVKAGVFGYSRLAGNAAHLKGGSLSTDENDNLIAAYLEGGKSKIVTKATADKLSKLWIDNASFALNQTKNNNAADGTWGNAAYDEYEATDESGASLFNRGGGRYFKQTPLGIDNQAGVFKIGYALLGGLAVANDGFRGAQPAPSSGDNAQYGLSGNSANHDSIIASKGIYFLGAHGVYKPDPAGEIDNTLGQAFCNWYNASGGAQKVIASLVGFDPRAVAYSASKIFVLFDNRNRKQAAAAESFKIARFTLSAGALEGITTLNEAAIGRILGAGNQELSLGLVVVARTITIVSRQRNNDGRTGYSLLVDDINNSFTGGPPSFFSDLGYLSLKVWVSIFNSRLGSTTIRVTEYGINTQGLSLTDPLPPDLAGYVKNSDKSGSQNSALYSYSGNWSRVEINGVEHALGARELFTNTTNDAEGTTRTQREGRPANTVPLYRQEFARFSAGSRLRFKDASGKWWPAPSANLSGTKRPFPARGLSANGENISLCIGGLLNATTIKNALITIDTAGNYIQGQYALGITGKIAVLGNFIYNIPFIPAVGQIAAYYANSVIKTPLASGAASVVAAFNWTAAGQLTRAVRLEKEAGGFMMFGQRVHTARTAREEKRISLFGVTDKTQAEKYLNLQKRMLEKLYESWSFETDIQAIVAMRGDKVGLNHYEISKTQFTARIAGFVKNAGGMITGIQIDQSGVPVLEPGKNYGCKALSENASPDFAVLAIADVSAKDERQNIQSGGENLTTRAAEPIRVRPKLYKTLRLSVPQAAAGFAPKVGDYVVFGEMENKYRECLVNSISMDKNLRARVILVPYIESIYSQI